LNYADYTYIVTGCTGYVGNVLTKRLMQDGCKVVGLARSGEKAKRVFGDRTPTLVYGDVRDTEILEKLFTGEGPFVVIHTVAYVSIGEGDEEEMREVTVEGTQKMLEVAMRHNVVKFLHISSTESLPHGVKLDPYLKGYVPDPAHTRRGYNRAKAEADVRVLAAAAKGLNASMLMLAGVLGPGDYSNTHMTQVMIDYINDNLPASVDGGYNDFDIRDVADVLPAIVERAEKGEFYLFANKPDKINEVLGYVGEATGREPLSTLPIWVAYVGLPFLWLGAKLSGKRPLYTASALASLRADTDFPLDKVKEQFGYAPRPLRDTVKDHVQFLIDEGMVTL